MSTQITCWFTTTYKMRTGQTGWHPESSSRLAYDNRILTIKTAMNGTIRTYLKHLPDDQMPDDPPPLVIDKSGDKIDQVEVSVQVVMESAQFEKGLVDDIYVEACALTRDILRKEFPDTDFWSKPN